MSTTLGDTSASASASGNGSGSGSESEGSTMGVDDTSGSTGATTTDETTSGGSSTRGDDSSGSGSSTAETGDSGGLVCGEDVVCTGNTAWSRRFGNSDATSSNESISAVATDPDGFSYMVGPVTGSADFGALGVIEGPNAGFVAKVDPDGAVIWVRPVYGGMSLSIRAIELDEDGNAAIVGQARGSVDLGAGPIAVDSGNSDIFLASFDTDGGLRFAATYGFNGQTESPEDVAVHSDGTIAVTGGFYGAINFGGNQLSASTTYPDAFVAVFDSGGGHLWSRRYGDGSTQRGYGIAFDGDANVIVAAQNYDTIDFGGMPHISESGQAIALAKLEGDTGERIWSRQFQSSNTNTSGLPRLEADAERIYLGTYSSSVDVKSIDWGLGAQDGYFHVVAFDQDGQTQWSRPISSLRGVQDLQPDLGGAVIVVGTLQGSAEFGDTELTSFENSSDALIVKYDGGDGTPHWARAIGDVNQQAGSQRGFGVGVDAQGYIYFGGSFGGVIDFGDGQMTASGGFSGTDGFLAKLEP